MKEMKIANLIMKLTIDKSVPIKQVIWGETNSGGASTDKSKGSGGGGISQRNFST